jgi:hypothetical protein
MDRIDRDETSATAAEKQHPDEKEVLRADPVKGEVDYARLIRDTIARFPKILAALAK